MGSVAAVAAGPRGAAGGVGWVALFTFGGYFFGNIAFVRKNFSLVIIAIILISLLPAVLEFMKHRREKGKGPAA